MIRWLREPTLTALTLFALFALMFAAQPGAAWAQSAACEGRADWGPSGAYRRADGSVLSVLAEGTAGRGRIIDFETGRSHRLYPVGEGTFRSAADLDSEQPEAFRYRFDPAGAGSPVALTIDGVGSPPVLARRIGLRERQARFRNGEIELNGRLTLPAAGTGPFKTVIFVHGSDPVPSAGLEWLPHLLASQGVATLVFDKRGTGCSKGSYVQHFDLLSDDVVAAARWLREQPEVDAKRLGLAGFSQGGWVAPLAARKDPAIGFVAVAYGLAMSMADEDRLEAPLKLKDAGVDAASVAEFEQLNAALHQVARASFQDWSPFERLLQRFQDRPWLAVAARQASWLGVVMQMGVPQAKQVAPQMFKTYFQPFYDPVPTLERLDIPMLWLIAEQDREAPPGPTLEVIQRLRRQGKPLTLTVFPGADHGMQTFELRAGQRIRTAYADGYFRILLQWVQAQR